MKRGSSFETLFVGLALSGCANVLGVDDYRVGPAASTPPPTYAGACGKDLLYADKSCRDCVDKACCPVATACDADPACSTAAKCLARCDGLDDHACRGKCNLDTLTQSIESSRLGDLVQCATACKTCAASRAVWGARSCDECVGGRECAAALRDYSMNRNAIALQSCDCGGLCPKCEGSYSAGKVAYDALNQCQMDNCPSDCGTDWSCLGSVVWSDPPRALQELELNVRVLSLSRDFNTPLAGARVSACDEFDAADCPNYRAQGISLDDGWATLTIPRSEFTRNWFFGHLRVTTDDPAFGTTFFYLFPPPRDSPSNWPLLIVPSKATAAEYASRAGIPPDDRFGAVVFDVSACFSGGPGVTVTIDSGERTFYLGSDGAVDPNLGQTNPDRPVGFLANVLPGGRVLEAKLADELVGRYKVLVAANTLTSVHMVPAPR